MLWKWQKDLGWCEGKDGKKPWCFREQVGISQALGEQNRATEKLANSWWRGIERNWKVFKGGKRFWRG